MSLLLRLLKGHWPKVIVEEMAHGRGWWVDFNAVSVGDYFLIPIDALAEGSE
jgi:hypothetical protein